MGEPINGRNTHHPLNWIDIERTDDLSGGEYVFISSTCYDLADLRNELSAVMTEWGLRPLLSDIGTSYFETSPGDSISSCLLNVDRADVFVLILSQRYSRPLHWFAGGSYGPLTATQVEVCRALELRHRYQECEKRVKEVPKPDRSVKGKPKPLTTVICLREDLYREYFRWIRKPGMNRLCKTILAQSCHPLCGGELCQLRDILNCCNLYVTSLTSDDGIEDKSREFLDLYKKIRQVATKTCFGKDQIKCIQLIEKTYQHLRENHNSWLNLFPKDAISSKAQSQICLQVLAQFFLIYILKRYKKLNPQESQPFIFQPFNNVTDLKVNLRKKLRPQIQYAVFMRELTLGRLPVLNVEIPSVSTGAPLFLYLILKNASNLPIIWTQGSGSLGVYKTAKSRAPFHSKDLKPIGTIDADIKCNFESNCSALLPGETLMTRIEWPSDLRGCGSEKSKDTQYFIQINYRTFNDLFIADIFAVDWLEQGKRPVLRFVKKIPYFPDYGKVRSEAVHAD